MSIEKTFQTLETAMEWCTSLQAELNEKVSSDERGGRFMRTFELLDLLEHSLIETARELKEAKV